MEAAGIELPHDLPGNPAILPADNAESDARGARDGGRDADLERVNAVWPGLSPEVRRRVVGLIDKAVTKAETTGPA